MSTWIHSAIIATSLAACAAVGLASASIYSDVADHTAAKADRLPLVGASNAGYRTIELRMNGMSILSRVPIAE